jgi:nicotinate-nucleotide adenylyltransferase
VKYFRQKYGDDVDLHWLVGADMIADLHRWYEIDDLIDICNLSVMYRGGCDKPDFSAASANFSAERLLKLEENIVLTPLVDVSSTEIRRSVRKCESIDQMVASAVADYIADNSLYSPL